MSTPPRSTCIKRTALARPTVRRVVLGAVIVAALATSVSPPSSARAAGLGSAFASTPVNCTTTTSGSLLAAAHPDAIARLTASSGSGNWYWGKSPSYLYYGGQFSAGDRLWDGSAAYAVNDAPAGSLSCSASPGSGTIELFDLPTTPVTFSDLVQSPASTSSLQFRVPSTVRLAADVAISQGAVVGQVA